MPGEGVHKGRMHSEDKELQERGSLWPMRPIALNAQSSLCPNIWKILCQNHAEAVSNHTGAVPNKAGAVPNHAEALLKPCRCCAKTWRGQCQSMRRGEGVRRRFVPQHGGACAKTHKIEVGVTRVHRGSFLGVHLTVFNHLDMTLSTCKHPHLLFWMRFY